MKRNNIGAISALKGYRVQFLYTLLRILSHKEFEVEFRPEGRFEDLDIYNDKGEVLEIIQVKSYTDTLTLSAIISPKENVLIKRSLQVYKENLTPKINLISFNSVNDDIKSIGLKNYPPNLIKKLKNQNLNDKEIKILEDNFNCEVVNEQEITESINLILEKWFTTTDNKIIFDLLIYWIYCSAEKQEIITTVNLKEQIEVISKFQRGRSNFTQNYHSLIRALENDLESENVDHLKDDFYKGISASYKHILAEVDVIRDEKIHQIQEKFKKSNIVFIHGASGQGKSTLAYRYLYENCSNKTVFELKHLPEEISTIYEVINALEEISKGLKFPITIYIDVEPGNKEWINILTELASKKNFDFLVTIREEDWNSIEVNDKFSFSEIELLFDQKEAELLYHSLNNYNTDLRFIDFENAWESFGGSGPLLEFVYLITQNESLSAKLKSQINKIRSDSSSNGKEKIKLLKYIVLADCFGSKIKYKELAQFLELNEIGLLVDLLQREYLIKISGDKTYLTGLHPVRSEIIKELLFDNEINIESDYVLDLISFVSENTILNFLKNGFRRSNLLPKQLLEKLKQNKPKKWQSYLFVFKSLLWKGIDDYINKNGEVLNLIYKDLKKGWITVADFDFADVLDGGSMIETSDIFSEEQKQYAQTINLKFSDKKEIFTYCLDWLNSIKQIDSIPNNKDEWDAFGLYLFWLNYFKIVDVIIDFENMNFEDAFENEPLEVLAHVLYGLKTFNQQSLNYAIKTEEIFLKRLSTTFGIITIEQENKSIICNYLFDIINEQIDPDENDFMNVKSMKIIDLLRFAFPDKDFYGTKGFGHQFSFSLDNHDSSIKQISKKYLPLKPLVEINSTYINLFNYTKRPSTWNEYVNSMKIKRENFIASQNDVILGLKEFNKYKNFNSLSLYVLSKESSNSSIPLLPKDISDKWGEFGYSDFKENTIYKTALSIKKYKDFEKIFNDYSTAVETFLSQSKLVVFSKIKCKSENIEFDVQLARTSLVANLYKAFKIIDKFQISFRSHFEKFIEINELQKIEKQEKDNLSILCFLYRQFINSETFLNGNISKLALDRFRDTELSLKKKIINNFKQLSKELDIQIKVDFDEKNSRCVILLNIRDSLKSFEILKILYDKLYEIIEQPDYTSIKYLIIDKKYPTFNIIVLISDKVINPKWHEFKSYNLSDKKYDELKSYNFLPQDIPQDVLDKYNIESWHKSSKEFEDLNKLLISISMANQLAFHLVQFKYFDDKILKEHNQQILNNYKEGKANLFQENLQVALNLYTEICNQDQIEFNNIEERKEFLDFLIENYPYFTPNDDLFGKEFNITLEEELFDEWIPRLDKLTNSISILYYFLVGKLIERGMQ